MSLLDVVKDVMLWTGVGGIVQPTSVFGGIASDRTLQEMKALADDMAQRIAYDTRDWTKLRKTFTMNGDGINAGFNLPNDYQRMLLTAEVWRSTNPTVPSRFVPDTNEWLQRRARGIVDAYGEWTMLGGQILIYPIMTIGQSAYFAYLHKNCINLGAGGTGDMFVADTDNFFLGDRVLKLGMRWQWKANKGSPYAEDMTTYGDALTALMGRDSPAPTIVGRRPLSQTSLGTAYPGMIPT